jgi:hypothetical protein
MDTRNRIGRLPFNTANAVANSREPKQTVQFILVNIDDNKVLTARPYPTGQLSDKWRQFDGCLWFFVDGKLFPAHEDWDGKTFFHPDETHTEDPYLMYYSTRP